MKGPRSRWRAVVHPDHPRTNWSRIPADQSGFTLIELLVVIIILGVLIAVAIPIFIRQTNLAKETSAESMLSGMGQIAYIGINQDLEAQPLVDEVQQGTRTGIGIDYAVGAQSTAKDDVVALIPAGTVPGQWLGAVQPRSGRCTMINVTDANGVIAARTIDSINGQCRADLSSTIPLLPSDFNTTILNPQSGLYNQGNANWIGNTLNMGYGMLLNKAGSTSFVNGSLSAKIALEPTPGTTTGLAFRGSTDPVTGKYSGYVYQIDRGSGSTPSAVVWKWVNGQQTAAVLNIPLNGINATNPNDLQIDVSGNTFTAKVNGSTVGAGALDPAYVGTSYGVRNGTGKVSTVTDLKLTPVS